MCGERLPCADEGNPLLQVVDLLGGEGLPRLAMGLGNGRLAAVGPPESTVT